MPPPAAPLVLASASPRRRALLAALGLPFTVTVADVDEAVRPGEAPRDYVRRLALEKAHAVAASLRAGGRVLGADTTVVLDGAILGKPAGAADARRMLGALTGRRHEVITAVALVELERRVSRVVDETTAVWLRPLAAEEIDAYVASGDPLDKAGGYAIQHAGFRPVARLVGSEANVIGLPLARVAWLLES
jgi:septum formation protein